MLTTTTDERVTGRLGWAGPRLTALAVALVLGLGCAAAAYLVVGHRPGTYAATSATLLDEPRAIALSQDSGIIDKLSRLRFKYTGILRSDEVTAPVETRLGLPRGSVSGRVFASGDPGSLLLFVGARGDSPKGAVDLANALAGQLAAYVDREQRDGGIAPVDRVSLKVVAPARGAAQLTPTRRQKLVAGAGAGLAAFVVGFGVSDLLRRRSG